MAKRGLSPLAAGHSRWLTYWSSGTFAINCKAPTLRVDTGVSPVQPSATRSLHDDSLQSARERKIQNQPSQVCPSIEATPVGPEFVLPAFRHLPAGHALLLSTFTAICMSCRRPHWVMEPRGSSGQRSCSLKVSNFAQSFCRTSGAVPPLSPMQVPKLGS